MALALSGTAAFGDAGPAVAGEYENAREALFNHTLVLARLALAAHDDAAAERLYRDAFELRPYDADTRRALVLIYEKNADYAALVEVYGTVLERVGSAVPTRARLARALFLCERRDEALAALRALVDEDPQDATRSLTAARVCAARGLFDDARRFLDGALRRFPGNPRLLGARARLALLDGQREEARAAAVSALAAARSDALERDLERLLSVSLDGADSLDRWITAARERYERTRDEQIARLLQRAQAATTDATPLARELLRRARPLTDDPAIRSLIDARLDALPQQGEDVGE